MTKVMILGSTGMLGSAVTQVFEKSEFNLVRVARKESSSVDVVFDAGTDHVSELFSGHEKIDFIINCIGIIKPYIGDQNSSQVLNALNINSKFPHLLAAEAKKHDVKIIQIATDCVYSGAEGKYLENQLHDATDVYGKTKSLGEVFDDNFMNLRASIIGKEIGRSTSLWEWVINQEKNAQINGFTDHEWNGVTTLHFGKIAAGIINSGLFRGGTFHLIPADAVSKYDLVKMIAKSNQREDIQISKAVSSKTINRTLSTQNPEFNAVLWASAGYKTAPSISDMVQEAS